MGQWVSTHEWRKPAAAGRSYTRMPDTHSKHLRRQPQLVRHISTAAARLSFQRPQNKCIQIYMQKCAPAAAAPAHAPHPPWLSATEGRPARASAGPAGGRELQGRKVMQRWVGKGAHLGEVRAQRAAHELDRTGMEPVLDWTVSCRMDTIDMS